MTCPSCKTGATVPGTATATLNRDGTIIVIKNVPADVCTTCAEPHFDDLTTSRLVQLAYDARRRGVWREVREYTAA